MLAFDASDPRKTVLRLLSHDDQDEVYLLSGYAPGREAAMVQRVQAGDWPDTQRLNSTDEVRIPNVSFNVRRE